MQRDQCELCGAEASIRFASVSAWLCAACATKVSQARRARRQWPAERPTLNVAPLAIRRTESLYRNSVPRN